MTLTIKGSRHRNDTVIRTVPGGVELIENGLDQDAIRWCTSGFTDWTWDMVTRQSSHDHVYPHEPDFLTRLSAYLTRIYRIPCVLL